ncbi:MAG: cbb3-type cytochrome c oxidase subunit 3 [Proteobacteria bacterium]|nr:cbb3-type cytochrome c oxidase subunit 3 [Pseudomonadota bacterium]
MKLKSEVLQKFSMPGLTVFACVLFVVVFSGMLIWTFRKGSKSYYEKCGKIPLEDDLNNRESL